MVRFRYFAGVLLVLGLLLPGFAASHKKLDGKAGGPRRLDRDIEQLLSDPEAASGFWGIDAVALDSGKPIFRLNQDKLFTPASNAKLFTTAAVFALIGPDYRFKTTVETLGTLDKYGRLDADLVVVGRGDPNLSGRTLPYNLHTERRTAPIQVLQQLADQLVLHGLKYVDGDIVADDSFFVFERYSEGWAQDDLAREWGAPVSALTVNDNVIFVNLMPADRAGERAFLNITPFAEYYKVDNRVMTTPQGTGPRTVSINREPGSNLITFWGNIPQDDPGFSEALAIEDPADFTARLFRQLLEERGVTIYGRARTHHTELASTQTFSVTSIASGGGDSTRPRIPGPLVLASYESQPVAQDLRVINKVSQNLHAELLLRLLGKVHGDDGSIAQGLRVERQFMLAAGVNETDFYIYDGSGMCPYNRIAPRAYTQLLSWAGRQSWASGFRESLPIAGVDGTLVNRFTSSPLKSKLWAKTGTMTGVNALSGYLTASSGRLLAFSILVNGHRPTSEAELQAIDRIAEAIAAAE